MVNLRLSSQIVSRVRVLEILGQLLVHTVIEHADVPPPAVARRSRAPSHAIARICEHRIIPTPSQWGVVFPVLLVCIDVINVITCKTALGQIVPSCALYPLTQFPAELTAQFYKYR